MAITVTPNLTDINQADSTTGWAGTATVSQTTAFYRESNACMGMKLSQSTGYMWYTGLSATNMHNRLIYGWALTQVAIDSKTNHGIALMVGDGSGTARWAVGGNDTPGGWRCYAVNVDETEGHSEGIPAPSYSAITSVGFYFDVTGKGLGNVENVFVDVLRYGTGLTITSGSPSTPGTFADIESIDQGTGDGYAYGVIREEEGIFYIQGDLTFGDSSGTGDTYFSDNSAIVQYKSVFDSFAYQYNLNVVSNSTGTTSFQLGTPVGSGSSTVGTAGVTISASETGSNNTNPVDIDFADGDIDTLKIYGSSFVNVGAVDIGSTTTVLGTTGSTVELVDNTFTSTEQVVRNISTNATNLQLRNSIVQNEDTRASMDIYDVQDVDSDEWTIIEGTGFESSATATEITITGEAFSNTDTNKPYVSVQDSADATWNLNNVSDGAGGRIVVGSNQTELAFDDTASPWVGSVNENFIVTWKTQEPDGDAIGTARVKIVSSDDGAGNPALENEDSSDGSGDATSTYLRSNYVPSGTSTITETEHTPSAFKSYKWDYLPFYTSATINSAVSVTATHLSDPYNTGTAAAAITAGETGTVISIIEASTNEHSLIKFTGGSGGTLSDNDTITASGGTPATGQVVGKIIEGDSTAGTILLDNRNAQTYDNGETLSNGGGWTATYTNDSEQRFHWIIDAGFGEDRTAQNVYDYIMAKLDEATADTSPPIDDLIVAGRAEFGTPLQGVSTGPNKFQTVDNDALNQGWAIANLADLSEITQFTDNGGAAFNPAQTVTLEINGVTEGTRCHIEAASGGPETVGAVLMSEEANSSGVATQSYSYTTDQPVIVRARLVGYLPFESTGNISSAGLTVTAVWQTDAISDTIDFGAQD
jgi:hypothetical protein